MRAAPLIALAAGALLGAPAAASAASAEVLVVGKTRTLQETSEVRLQAQRVRVGGRRCAVGGATPLAILLRAKPKVALRDYGRCGRSARDAGGLFVTQVGRDRNRGQDGWVYKVGRRSGSVGAGDPVSRVRDGQRVLWFWCEMASAGCQRTLEVAPAADRVAPGAPLRVTVRGYDDDGRGVVVAGATVRLGAATAVTDTSGVATVTAPADASGSLPLDARADGAVPAFRRRVTVG